MIYVSGASGVIGDEVVRQLRAEGAPVRALVHHPENAEALEALGAEIALGDLSRPQTLEAGLEGAERLFLLSPSDPEMAQLEANLVDAAARAGVRRVVKQSAYGAAPDAPVAVGRAHAESERHLEGSGTYDEFAADHAAVFRGDAPI